MEIRKIGSIVLFAAALGIILINILVIYPYISCELAPLTFWLLSVICVVIGLILYFDVKVFHFEEA